MLRLALFTPYLLPTQVALAVANPDAASPDTWSVVGFSAEFGTSAVTPGYGYINGKFVASGNNIAVAGTLPGTNPTTDLVLGNRASDGIRGWDGM